MSFGEFEIKNKPLFASMKRVKSAYLKNFANACSIMKFFSYLEKLYGNASECIEYITFYDYINRCDNIHYHIAYIYTAPSLKMRDLLFEDREMIIADTGWYPMVSGSRANFTTIKTLEIYSYWNIASHSPPYVHLGKPLSINNVACDISSTALLLRCEKGNILFDTGFGVDPQVIDDVNFIFLSHFHQDHSGGVFSFLKVKEVPLVLSGITLEYLLNLKNVDGDDKRRLLKNAVLIEGIKNRPYISSTLEFFYSYHCPGAYGVKYQYYDNIIIYPGDVCLVNGFFDFSKEFDVTISDRHTTSVIIDCALIRRNSLVAADMDFSAVINRIQLTAEGQLFVSRGIEVLFNVYIRLFKESIDRHMDCIFLINDELYCLLKTVLRTWLLPDFTRDPYIKHVIARSRINYSESQRLYPLSAIEQFVGYHKRRLMVLASVEDLQIINKSINTEQMDAFIIGPLALDKGLPKILENFAFRSIHKLSSPDWSFHSEKESIMDFINRFGDASTQFILFHSFPNILKKFVKEFPDDVQKKLSIISKNELFL